MAQEENRNNRTSSALVGMVVFALLAGMTAAIAWVLQDQLIFAWRIIRHYQYQAMGYIPFIGPSPDELPGLLEWLRTTPSREIFGSTMWEIDQHYGRHFGFILAAGFLWVGVSRIRRGMGGTGPELSADNVIDLLTPIFPHLAYIKENNPAGKPIKYRPGQDNRFAMPVQDFEFAEMSPPMGLEKILTPEQLKECRPIYIKDEPNFFAAFDKSLARKAFECQMGPPLLTLKDFSEPERKAFYFFKKRLDTKLPKGHSVKIIQRLEQKHGYVRTFLMSLFEEAKRLGIMTTNDELMPIMDDDRTLFYCLDSIGRDTPWIEAAGPFVHKDMEDLVGIRITEPEVTEAVDSLERYLKLDRATEKEIAESLGEHGLDEESA